MSAKILVVDDDAEVLEMCKIILEDGGYNVITNDGTSVESTVREKLPDLVILDVVLPGFDGREISKRIKKHDSTKHIPIILISANINLNNTSDRSGADYFLNKPFNIDELHSIVKVSLNFKRLT